MNQQEKKKQTKKTLDVQLLHKQTGLAYSYFNIGRDKKRQRQKEQGRTVTDRNKMKCFLLVRVNGSM